MTSVNEVIWEPSRPLYSDISAAVASFSKLPYYPRRNSVRGQRRFVPLLAPTRAEFLFQAELPELELRIVVSGLDMVRETSDPACGE